MSCSGAPLSSVTDNDLNVVNLDRKTRSRRTLVIAKETTGLNRSGPEADWENLEHDNRITKELAWGLALGPGLNRVICQVIAVKSLQEKGIKFSIYTGAGMGAIVAAYLAQGITPEIIEWNFHKFFEHSKELRPLTSEWLSLVKQDLLKDFIGVKIQSTKFTLLIPVYNNREGKIEFIRRGNLHVKLLENLKMSKLKSGLYSSSLERGRLSFNQIREIGVQKVVEINVLGDKIKFSHNEDYLFGLYGKLTTLSKNSKADYLLKLPLDNFNLDTIADLPAHLQRSYKFMQEKSIEIKNDYTNERKK